MSSSLSAEEKRKKANQSVRDSRLKSKQKEENLYSRKESLQNEINRHKVAVKVEQNKNALFGQIVDAHNQFNPGASSNPRMQKMKDNISNPIFGAYDADKSWKEQKGQAQAWKQYTPAQSWKNGPK